MSIEEVKTELNGIVVVQLFPFAATSDVEFDRSRENAEVLAGSHDVEPFTGHGCRRKRFRRGGGR